MHFPKWFFTRPNGFALLLVTLLVAECNLSLGQAGAGGAAGSLALLATGVVALGGTVALLLILWLTEFTEPHDYDEWRTLRWFVYALLTANAWIFRDGLQRGDRVSIVVVALCFFALAHYAATRSVPKPGERRRGEPPRQAWLVVTIDLRKQPPVVGRAAIFSCPGSSLTSLGHDELNLDVLDARGDSYEQARAEILRLVPLYCPRLVPLLQKSGESIEL